MWVMEFGTFADVELKKDVGVCVLWVWLLGKGERACFPADTSLWIRLRARM